MTASDDPFKKTDAYRPPGGEPVPGAPASGDPAQGYGGGWGGSEPPPRKNGLAIAALVVGILALLSSITVLGGIVLGLVAIVLGAIALSRARKGAGGGVMAGFGLGLGIVGLVIGVGIIALGFSFLNSDAGQSLQECVEQAQTQAEADQCAVEFEEDFLN